MGRINVLDWHLEDLYLALLEPCEEPHHYYDYPLPMRRLSALEHGAMNFLEGIFELVKPYLESHICELVQPNYNRDSDRIRTYFNTDDYDESSDDDESGNPKKPTFRDNHRHKNLIFLAVLYRRLKKQKWMDTLRTEQEQDWIDSTVAAGQNLILTAAAVRCRGGCVGIGAVIRDLWGRPIVSYSGEMPSKNFDSWGRPIVAHSGKTSSYYGDDLFDAKLEGVNQGLKLCNKYGWKYVSVYLPDEDVVSSIRSAESTRKHRLKDPSMKDGSVIQEIARNVQSICCGSYSVNPCPSHKNLAAESLARICMKGGMEISTKWLVNQCVNGARNDINLDIPVRPYSEFLDVLYEEASSERGLGYFRMRED